MYLQVPLSGFHGKNKFAKVDKEDYQLVQQYSWHYRDGYAVTKINKKEVRMHRFVMNETRPEVIVDHKNRDRLDNTKANLRLYTPKQNANNRETSRYIIAFNEKKTIGEWVSDPRCGCSYNVLVKRLNKEIWPEIAILAADDRNHDADA